MADLDLITVVDDRLFDDGTDSQDRGLGRIHDGTELFDAIGSEVGDGDGSTRVFVGLELLVAGTEREILHGSADLLERELLGIADHRSDETILDGDRNREIHASIFNDGIASEGGVDLRLLHGGAGHRGKCDIVEGDLPAAGGDVLLAEGHHRGGVDLDREIEVRNLGLAGEQALGDDAAHAGKRNLGLGHPGDRRRQDGGDWGSSGGCRG